MVAPHAAGTVRSALRAGLRRLLRLYTLHAPLHKGKGWLVHVALSRLWQREQPIIERVGCGYWMALDLADYIERCIYFFGYYEKGLARWLQARLAPGMVVCDVGAHVGQYTLLAASVVGPSGRVYAFEPEPRIFARLEENIRRNGMNNVVLRRCAVCNRSGKATFYIHEGGDFQSGNHSLLPDQKLMRFRTITVDTIRLDDILQKEPRLDFMKIDVEGAEMAVLQGATQSITFHRPIILFEAEERNTRKFGYTTVQLKRYVSSLDYAIYRAPEGERLRALDEVRMNEVEPHSMLVAFPE